MKKFAGIIIGCLLLAVTGPVTNIDINEVEECNVECSYVQIQPSYGELPPKGDPEK